MMDDKRGTETDEGAEDQAELKLLLEVEESMLAADSSTARDL